MYAPGTQIVSAYYSSPSTYAQMSGTSVAAPHVAGAAAVTLGLQPSLSPAEVTSRIASDATPGVVVGATSGTPNRLLFLAQPVTPDAPEPAPAPAPVSRPAPETDAVTEPDQEPVLTRPGRAKHVAAKPARRTAKLSWTRSVTDGSLTKQLVRVYLGKKRDAVLRISPAANSLRVKGLTPGRSPESRLSGKVVPRR